MTWQRERVVKRAISLKEMSVQYWPSEGTEKYNLVSVTLQDEKVVEDYVIRKFSITNTTVPKNICCYNIDGCIFRLCVVFC